MPGRGSRLRRQANALREALNAHYSPAASPNQQDQDPDARTRALRSWGFTPDPSMEAQEARRQKDPAAFGPIALDHALYLAQKAAAAKETE
jgi:hypothetical protein